MAGDITTYVVAGVRYDSVVKTVVTTVQKQKFNSDTGEPYMVSLKGTRKEIEGFEIDSAATDIDDAIERLFGKVGLQVFYSNSTSTDAERVIGIELAHGDYNSEYFQQLDYGRKLHEVEAKLFQLLGKSPPVGIFMVVSVDM